MLFRREKSFFFPFFSGFSVMGWICLLNLFDISAKDLVKSHDLLITQRYWLEFWGPHIRYTPSGWQCTVRIHMQSEDTSKNKGETPRLIKTRLKIRFQKFRGNLDRFRPIDVLYRTAKHSKENASYFSFIRFEISLCSNL